LRPLAGLLLTFWTGVAAAHPGWGIVVDKADDVFYTDLEQVWKIGADGAKTIVVPDVHTHELYLDPRGVLHGEHLWYDNKQSKWGHYLWELTDGRVVRHPPQEGFRTESFIRDPGGTRYSLDAGRVLKRPPGGGAVQEVVDTNTGPISPGQAPGGLLTLGEDGLLYLVQGGDLLRITTAGEATVLATGLDEHVWTSFMTQPWHYVMGLTADAGGNVYVANSGARKVKKVDRNGKVTEVLRARFPWSPTGVTTKNGVLYVLEYTDTGGSVRVRTLTPDGRVRMR